MKVELFLAEAKERSMENPNKAKPTALLAMSPATLRQLFSPTARAQLESLTRIGGPLPAHDLTDSNAGKALAEAEILVTGWGSSFIDDAVLDRAKQLRWIVHAAGTIKPIISDEVFRRGIRVTSCAAANALPVAEFTLASIVFGLKRSNRLSARLKETKTRRDLSAMPTLGTNGVTVGLVGASRVGREVIRLLSGLDVSILVSDPYLSETEAGSLGVEAVEIDELCRRSDILSLHAPQSPATWKMIGRHELSLLKDGAVVVNTSRGSLIDTDALTAEAVSGRLDAYLDVTDPEPLPAASPLYALPNVTLTPHIAGALGNEIHRLGDQALSEIERIASGQSPAHEVFQSDLVRIA